MVFVAVAVVFGLSIPKSVRAEPLEHRLNRQAPPALKLRQQPTDKSVFPDVDFAPIAAGFGFEAETIRTLDDLRRLAPRLRKPEGPIFLDCKLNADVAAPFMSEFAHFFGRH